MKHLFVPYEIALLLKEKGFNEPCLTAYTPEDGLLDVFEAEEIGYMSNSQLRRGVVAAPLYQQVEHWLIVNHGLYAKPYSISLITWGYHVVRVHDGVVVGRNIGGHNGYIDARNSSIKHALNLI